MRSTFLFYSLVIFAALVLAAPVVQAQSIFGNTAVLNTNAWTDLGADVHPKIATDGAGNWVAVWTSRDSLNGTIGTEGDILFARSTDGAVTWSVPAVLNTTAWTDRARDEHPAIATDAAGTWIAVWDRIDPYGGSYGSDHDVFFAKSIDEGISWTDPVPVNPNAASDLAGEWGPRIVTDGDLWVVWWGVGGGPTGADDDLFVSSSADDGATWSTPSPVNPNAWGDRVYDVESDLATDGRGTWVATWRISSCCEPQRIVTARSIDQGATWSAPTVLLWGWGFDTQVATDEKGNWVAAWSSNGASGFQDVFFARSADGLNWGPVAVLSTGDGGDHHVSLETDRAGTWVAVWEYGHYSVRQIRTAVSTDAGASWSPSEPLNGNTAPESRLFSYPYVVADGRGDWVALWTSNYSYGGAIGSDHDLLFARGWAPANASPVADAGPDQTLQCMTADGTAVATLDGSGSWDPDGDPLAFLWSEDAVHVAEGEIVDAAFTLGDHLVTLTVDDGLETDTDALLVTVEATLAGLESLTSGYMASGDIESRVGDALLESIWEAMTKVDKGMPDKAQRILGHYIDRIARELGRGNVSTEAADHLIGSAECIINFAL